jgi:arylsulfatase
VVALLLAVALAGCGESPPAGPAALRLILEPGARVDRRVETVASLLEPGSESAWTVTGGTSSVVSGGGLEGRVDGPIRPLWFRRKGRLDPAGFDGVRLHIASALPAHVSLVLLRKGAPLGTTEPTPVASSKEPAEQILELPAAIAARGACDELAIRVNGQVRRVTLASVELLSRTGGAKVPDPGEGSTLHDVQGESRRGWGLSVGAPLGVAAPVPVPEGGRFVLAVSVPPSARRDATLVMQAGPSGPRLSRALDALSGAGWTSLSLDLAELAGESVSLRVSLEGDDGAACVVAEPRMLGPPSERPRTVLLVTTDTHRGDHLGAAPGSADVSTPTLDALAGRGVLFSDCFSPINFTNPSHAALMTGTHPRDLGIVDNRTPLGTGMGTLAEAFAAQGFATWAAVSAGHLRPEVSGLGRGFERMSAPLELDRSADETLDVVAGWLAEVPPGRPVFLWLHVFDAHTPYVVPEPFDERGYDGPPDPFDPSLPEPELALPLRGALTGLRHLDWGRVQYGNLVGYLDHALGRVLEQGPFADGLVAVVGDHGESLGAHGLWFVHVELYPDTLHVPLVLAGPGVSRGAVVERPVTHLDLGRTLLDLSGYGATPFPGSSLLEEPEREAPRPGLSSLATSASWTEGGWHLVLHLRDHGGFVSHQVELYDLASDPRCERDLVEQDAERAANLRRRLVSWLAAAPDTQTGEIEVDDELAADLAALGYTGGEGSDGPFWTADDCGWCQRLER